MVFRCTPRDPAPMQQVCMLHQISLDLKTGIEMDRIPPLPMLIHSVSLMIDQWRATICSAHLWAVSPEVGVKFPEQSPLLDQHSIIHLLSI